MTSQRLAANAILVLAALGMLTVFAHGARLQGPVGDLSREGCAYAEEAAFQVGDKVLVTRPGASIHNTVHSVSCPGSTEGTAELVCLDNGECLASEDLQELEDVPELQRSLAGIQSHIGQLGEALASRWPSVQANIIDFAESTREKAMVAGAQALAAVNMCDEEKRADVAAAVAGMQSSIAQVAAAAAEKWPAVKGGLGQFGTATAGQFEVLSAKLKDAVKDTAEREAVRATVSSMQARFDELRRAAIDDNPPVKSMVKGLSSFSEAAAAVTVKILVSVNDTYHRKETQAILATIQSGAGQLAAAAADKWPSVKKALGSYAVASRDKIAELGSKALTAVNLCNPEKRQQLQDAFAAVSFRAGQLASAVAERWPAVKEGLSEFADAISTRLSFTYQFVSTWVKDAAERKEVRDTLEQLQAKFEELRAAATQQSVELRAGAVGAVQSIYDQVGGFILRVWGKEEAVDLDDSEVEKGDCFLADVKYHPANMKGHRRTWEASAEACQQRCANATGCAHFSWWPNGGCHLQDAAAKMRRAWRVTAGPAQC